MGLLTKDFPNPNSTSLAQIVLEGMGQLRSELAARTAISQNEQDNWLTEGKMAANNLLSMHSMFADQRDYNARQDQQGFNNYLGLSKLNMEQNESTSTGNYRQAEADKIRWQMQQPGAAPDAPPGTILDSSGAPVGPVGPVQGSGGAPAIQPTPPAGMAAPNMVNGSSDQPFLGGGQSNPLLPSIAAAPQQTSPQTMSEDLSAGATAGANSAVAGAVAGAAPGLLAQADGGQTPGLLMQTPAPAAPAMAMNAQRTSEPAAPIVTDSKSPWITADGGVDLTKIPTGKLVQMGPGSIVQRQKVGNVDQLQYYKKVEQLQPNGSRAQVTVPDGLPKVIMPEAFSGSPTTVMLPKDKVQAFDTAKFWLDKVFPKMDAKDRQANVPQAMQMQSTLQDLSNDPEVQKHLRSVDNADFATPAGFSVEGLHYDPKREMMVPTLKKDTPDELKAAQNQRATLKSMWDDYKGMVAIQNDSISSQTTKDKAKAKAGGLFQQIVKMDPSC